MSSYRWAVNHKCSKDQSIEILTNFGFEEDALDRGIYKIQINSWNLLKVGVKKSRLEFSFFWMGNDTTEIYYDYLIHCGILIGQIMRVLHDMATNGGQIVFMDPTPAENDDDDDDDDGDDDYDDDFEEE